ncbi:condensation domain-containing protein, partial [Klebsiella pneumoniae]|uniref:condensation domain-containing protein n=1 Tax=Klebsiella pneumoniae TaxID=573 RepID=UPI0013D30377
VAHYVELRGNLDPALLSKAIVAGLKQADTLSMRFCEDSGEAWQWVDDAREFAEPQSVDLRQQADPHMSALTLMQ